MLSERIGNELLLCKLAGVPFSEYEKWRDSISDFYFYAFADRVFDEDIAKVLMRVI